jgi:hypothetical protein
LRKLYGAAASRNALKRLEFPEYLTFAWKAFAGIAENHPGVNKQSHRDK